MRYIHLAAEAIQHRVREARAKGSANFVPMAEKEGSARNPINLLNRWPEVS